MIDTEIKNRIDSMSQYDIGHAIRFSPIGDNLMCGENYDYLMKRFKELGGMTPELSKRLGWR